MIQSISTNPFRLILTHYLFSPTKEDKLLRYRLISWNPTPHCFSQDLSFAYLERLNILKFAKSALPFSPIKMLSKTSTALIAFFLALSVAVTFGGIADKIEAVPLEYEDSDDRVQAVSFN